MELKDLPDIHDEISVMDVYRAQIGNDFDSAYTVNELAAKARIDPDVAKAVVEYLCKKGDLVGIGGGCYTTCRIPPV